MVTQHDIRSVAGDWTTKEATVASLFSPEYEVHKICDGRIDIIFQRDVVEYDESYVENRLTKERIGYDEVRRCVLTDNRIEVHL